MTAADIVVLILAVFCVVGAVALAVWRRKNGRSGCAGGCGDCPVSGRCLSRQKSGKDECDKCSR